MPLAFNAMFCSRNTEGMFFKKYKNAYKVNTGFAKGYKVLHKEPNQTLFDKSNSRTKLLASEGRQHRVPSFIESPAAR